MQIVVDLLSMMEQWLGGNVSYGALIGIFVGLALGMFTLALLLVRYGDYSK